MIKQLKIIGLNNSNQDLNFEFNRDLNLFTGRNGCGKTTILKIIWYINSGQIAKLSSEIIFKEIELTATNYSLKVNLKGDELKVLLNNTSIKIPEDIDAYRSKFYRERHPDKFKALETYGENSIFFPTFRRIEGGFSVDATTRYRMHGALMDIMNDISLENSSEMHQFITSVSTEDLKNLLLKERSLIDRKINALQKEKFEEIRKKIKNKKNQSTDDILKKIEGDILAVEKEIETDNKPFSTLEKLIYNIFNNKGIDLDSIKFGDPLDAISSDKLSAGEKQMLSFLCYNSFSKNKVIFIDEPELSLHPDWQRLIIPILLEQQNDNQFFVATHSPFIYSKYPDKELILDDDKG